MPSLKALHRALDIPADYGRARGIRPQREARRLVLVGRAPDDGRPVRLTPRAAVAWRRMAAAAAKDGTPVVALSGYRSVARQAALLVERLAGCQRLAVVLRTFAAPGYSEHHTGRAVDVGAPGHFALDAGFARTAAYRWLRRRAHEFGFLLSYPRKNPHGIRFEPWHWCWHPRKRG